MDHYDTIFNLISGPPTQPTAPLEIVALGPHSIMVEWGAPESDGGAPLEGYKVAVRDAKRHMWMEVGRVAADVQKLKVQELAVSINSMCLELQFSRPRWRWVSAATIASDRYV